MAMIVMKFGGTSVANAELINRAAQRVAREKKKENDIVVVVSAMGHTTDAFVKLSREITPHPPAREVDMLLTAGERISVALFSMALERLSLKAVSFTGSQVGIITDNKHTDARILEIRGDRLRKALADGQIPVVCGFQGVSMEKEITTLGRGGSDTTAVALSAALNADRCMIFTDVDGVYTEDPKRFPGAKKIEKISYEEMMELSSQGAQVLHPRASSIAARYGVPVEIRSSFSSKSGTTVTQLDGMEKPRPKAITHSEDLYLVTLVQVPKNPACLSQIVKDLTEHGIHLKFFFHGISDARNFDLSFITPLNEKNRVEARLKPLRRRLRISSIREVLDVCSISIIGTGIGSDNRVLAGIFSTLSKVRAHIEAVTTSELSINIFLHKKFLDTAVRRLMEQFGLAAKTT
ncbi:MAG TPA: aspartate kinase [bacterium]